MQLRHLASRMVSAPIPETPAKPQIPAAPVPAAPAKAVEAPAIVGTQNVDSRAILNSIGEVIYDWDLITDRLCWGENLARVLPSLAEIDLSSGIAFGALLAPESATSRYDEIVKSERADEGAGVLYQITYAIVPPREVGAAGSTWLEDTGCWFKGVDGRPARAHGVVRVVTERHNRERLLARQSQFDTLTGALNRTHLTEQMQRILDQTERNRKAFAVMLVALENLFVLNRTYGYDAGDEVIAGLATRLSANLRAHDLVARHAGNKFALVLPDCGPEEAKFAAMRLIEAVTAAPFETSAGAIPATIRIGGVVGPRDGRTTQALFQHAEEALDIARQRAGARFVA
ncbi:MAG: GGDEF domain-containing protein, partial [Methylocystis sp.]